MALSRQRACSLLADYARSGKSINEEVPVQSTKLPRIRHDGLIKRCADKQNEYNNRPEKIKGQNFETSDSGTVINNKEKRESSALNIEERVRIFIEQTLPERPPSTLKMVKPKLLPVRKRTFIERRKKTEKDQLPINNNTCPDNILKSINRFYYSHKLERCRYIRYPSSPVLSVEEIFW